MAFLKVHLVEPPKNPNSLSVTFECNKLDLPDFFEVNGVPVANTKLIKAFEVAGADNFQAFPVELHFLDGKKVPGYYIFNIVGRISCIDVNASKCTRFGSSIMRICNLVINPASTLGAAMFRETNTKWLYLYRKALKRRLNQRKYSAAI